MSGWIELKRRKAGEKCHKEGQRAAKEKIQGKRKGRGGSNVNIKLRLKNKTTLISLIAGAITLIYQVLGLCGIVPKISDEALLNVAGVAVNILCMLGIVVDPTTKGVKDSEQAMRYTEPRK